MTERLALVTAALVAILAGCEPVTNLAPPPRAISCQPLGYSPAPVAYNEPIGALVADAAEARAAALVRACMVPTAISDLTSRSSAAMGVRLGPNDGQDVWRVQVDVSAAGHKSHYLIEVNQATGIPTVIGIG